MVDGIWEVFVKLTCPVNAAVFFLISLSLVLSNYIAAIAANATIITACTGLNKNRMQKAFLFHSDCFFSFCQLAVFDTPNSIWMYYLRLYDTLQVFLLSRNVCYTFDFFFHHPEKKSSHLNVCQAKDVFGILYLSFVLRASNRTAGQLLWICQECITITGCKLKKSFKCNQIKKLKCGDRKRIIWFKYRLCVVSSPRP